MGIFRFDVLFEIKMDWSLYVICQDNKDKSLLRSPANGIRYDAYEVYKDFLENVEQFKSLDALPVRISFGEQCTPESFIKNNASFHRNCHQKFNKSKLNRVKQAKDKHIHDDISDDVRRLKRQVKFGH